MLIALPAPVTGRAHPQALYGVTCGDQTRQRLEGHPRDAGKIFVEYVGRRRVD
jgi:hypothetical protein